MPAPADVGKPRLPVDRAFTLAGVGTIATGTLAGGTLRKGQAVVVQPAGTAARVRSVQSHGRAVESAGPGARVALNLPDLQVRSADDARGAACVGRGDVVTVAELGAGTDTLDVLLRRSGRENAGAAGRVLRDGARVYVHHGSAAVAARVCLLDAAALGPGASALAQLRLEGRLFALAGDRLVIRDWPQRETLAGGIVLDPDAARRHFRSAERRAFLAARAAEPESAEVYVRSLLARDGVASRAELGVRSNFAGPAIEKALNEMAAGREVVDLPPLVASGAYWKSVFERAAGAIDAHHDTHPEQAGMPLEQLRATVRDELFHPLVRDLTEKGFVRSGAAVRRSTHLPKLPPRLQQAGDRLRRRLADSPFDPPSVNQLAPDDLSRQALKFLLISGEAVQLTADVVVSSDALARAAEIVHDEIRRHGPATVSRLKTALGSSRRVMVPLLERLDRDRVTRRDGDVRVLGEST
jgi:selenocysteine-specific elongation factor